MKRVVMCCALLLLGATMTGATAERTLTGVISDSHCGANNHPTEYYGRKITARECIIGTEDGQVRGCVNGGAEYILVSAGKIYQIRNQDFAGLRVHAAESVRVTGELAEDTITVTSISKEVSR